MLWYILYINRYIYIYRLWEPTRGNFAPFGDLEQGEHSARLSAHGRTIAIHRRRPATPYVSHYYIVADFIVTHASHTPRESYTHVYVWRINGRCTHAIYRVIRSEPIVFLSPRRNIIYCTTHIVALLSQQLYTYYIRYVRLWIWYILYIVKILPPEKQYFVGKLCLFVLRTGIL